MSTIIESGEPRSSKSSRVLENPPHARRTMEALREMGYDSYASILDIIDNSIDAHATIINVEIGEQKGDIVITIDDDGNPRLHYPGDYNIAVRGHRDIAYRASVIEDLGVTQLLSLTTPGTHVEEPSLALALARTHHVPMPVSSVVEQIMIEALNRGWGKGAGYTAHVALQEAAAGVQLRLPGIDAREAGKYLSTHPETGYLKEA